MEKNSRWSPSRGPFQDGEKLKWPSTREVLLLVNREDNLNLFISSPNLLFSGAEIVYFHLSI
jgi:hypothetical protein